MLDVQTQESTVIRTSMGLTISGTRLTLYHIWEDLEAGYSWATLKEWYGLSDKQIADTMEYIELHREAVEEEYRQVLQAAEARRQYWEERNREHFARVASLPSTPEQEELRAKLKAWKAKLAAERSLS